MQHTLEASTEAGTLVLYDPGNVEHLRKGATPGFLDLEREVADGRAFAYSLGGNGSHLLRVTVDEPPEERCERHAEPGVEGRLLRVPTGRLTWSGRESLSPAAVEPGRPEEDEPTQTTIRVPAGNYDLRAFDLDWKGKDEQALARIANPWDRALTWIGVPAGCVLAATVFVAPAVLAIVAHEGGSAAFWSLARGLLLFELVFWSVALSLHRFAEKRSTAHDPRRREIRIAHPHTVVVLTRLADGAALDGMTGGQLGVDSPRGKKNPRGKPGSKKTRGPSRAQASPSVASSSRSQLEKARRAGSSRFFAGKAR